MKETFRTHRLSGVNGTSIEFQESPDNMHVWVSIGINSVQLDYADWEELRSLLYDVVIKDPQERSCKKCYNTWQAGEPEKHYKTCANAATNAPLVQATAVVPSTLDRSYWTGEKSSAEKSNDDVPF